METVTFRGELLLTIEEASDYNKNLEKACFEVYGLELGYVPWRFCAIDQSIRIHTPSSLSLATALRELDATVDPSAILKQPINRRSSYRSDASPLRSPKSPSPHPAEVKVESRPVKKVEEKIEYDPNSDFYKLLHPTQDKLKSLPEWAQSIHKILVVICYMSQIKPFVKYFKPEPAEVTLNDEVDLDKTEGKYEKMDDFGFDVLSDDLNDILMDIDEIDPVSRRDSTQEVAKKKESDMKLEGELDGLSIVEGANQENGESDRESNKNNSVLSEGNVNAPDTSSSTNIGHLESCNTSNTDTMNKSDDNHPHKKRKVDELNVATKTIEPKVEVLNTNQSSKNNGDASDTIKKNGSSDTNNTNVDNKHDKDNHNNELNDSHTAGGEREDEKNNIVAETSETKSQNEVKLEGKTKVTEVSNDEAIGSKPNETLSQVKFDETTLVKQGIDEMMDGSQNNKLTDQRLSETTKKAEDKGFEHVLENLLENKYENSSYVFSQLYTFLAHQFKILLPGSYEWMCAQEIALRLDELRLEKHLKDAEKLHNFQDPPQIEVKVHQISNSVPHTEPKKQRTSMEDFEHELALINNAIEYSPTISLPEVKKITDDERKEFYLTATSLDMEYQLELFTVFEHAAVWKLVGNGEIELDDQNTDPKIYRGMIKWVKEKKNMTPVDTKETTIEMKQVPSEIAV